MLLFANESKRHANNIKATQDEKIMNIKKRIENFKAYYRASSENRTGVHMFLAFVIIPAVGLSLLFFIVYNFYV